MYIEAKLVFRYYVPEDYSSLLFLSMRKNHVPFVYSIEGLKDAEKYIEINGYPVRPYIILEGNPNIPNSVEILAQPEQIGWFDAGPTTEDLIDIEVRQFNDILEYDNGHVLIETDDDTDDVVLFQDKVTLMYVDSLDDEYEMDDDDEPINEDDKEDYNQIY